MDNRLSWAGKKTYQPNFEIAGAKERPAPKRFITGGDVVREKNPSLLGLETSLAVLCKEVPDASKLKKLKPAQIRAKRHAEKRADLRFRK